MNIFEYSNSLAKVFIINFYYPAITEISNCAHNLRSKKIKKIDLLTTSLGEILLVWISKNSLFALIEVGFKTLVTFNIFIFSFFPLSFNKSWATEFVVIFSISLSFRFWRFFSDFPFFKLLVFGVESEKISILLKFKNI